MSSRPKAISSKLGADSDMVSRRRLSFQIGVTKSVEKHLDSELDLEKTQTNHDGIIIYYIIRKNTTHTIHSNHDGVISISRKNPTNGPCYPSMSLRAWSLGHAGRPPTLEGKNCLHRPKGKCWLASHEIG